jgi:hypothetical protein
MTRDTTRRARHYGPAQPTKSPEPNEPRRAGLIRAGLTRDTFATDRILTRAFEADLDGLFFAFTAANLAGRILAEACGSEAQAVALMDNWIDALVRERARAVALQLELGFVPGLCLLMGLEAGLGFPLDPGRVIAAGLSFGLLCCDALRGLLGPG